MATLILAAIFGSLLLCGIAPFIVCDDVFKRRAMHCKLFGYWTGAIAALAFSYVFYQAVFNGIAFSTGKGTSQTFAFSDQPLVATLWLCINVAGTSLIAGAARACYNEHRVWIE